MYSFSFPLLLGSRRIVEKRLVPTMLRKFHDKHKDLSCFDIANEEDPQVATQKLGLSFPEISSVPPGEATEALHKIHRDAVQFYSALVTLKAPPLSPTLSATNVVVSESSNTGIDTPPTSQSKKEDARRKLDRLLQGGLGLLAFINYVIQPVRYKAELEYDCRGEMRFDPATASPTTTFRAHYGVGEVKSSYTCAPEGVEQLITRLVVQYIAATIIYKEVIVGGECVGWLFLNGKIPNGTHRPDASKKLRKILKPELIKQHPGLHLSIHVQSIHDSQI